MALLTGLTPEGLEVPVQVKPDGKLVAEGLTGPAGGVGPQGVAGPAGPAGPKGGEKWSGDADIYYMNGRVAVGTYNTGYGEFSVYDSDDAKFSIANGTTWAQLQQNSAQLYINWNIDGAAGGDLILRSGVNRDEQIRVNSNGNVGLGTFIPRVKLDVVGAIRATAGVQVKSPNGVIWQIEVNDAGTLSASMVPA